MRFTAALRRFIAPSKHKMCPAGKRAHAWVHPHFTFTADCRLNRPTFPDFLPRTASQFVSTDLLFPSYVPQSSLFDFGHSIISSSIVVRSHPRRCTLASLTLNCTLCAQNDGERERERENRDKIRI